MEFLGARQSRDVPVEVYNRPYENMLDLPYKPGYLPDVPDAFEIKPVKELLIGALQHQTYCLIRKSARYADDFGNEVKKMTE